MREPRVFRHHGVIIDVPYSAAPLSALCDRAAGYGVRQSSHPDAAQDCAEFFDPDFRRRYAAILLRERGA